MSRKISKKGNMHKVGRKKKKKTPRTKKIALSRIGTQTSY